MAETTEPILAALRRGAEGLEGVAAVILFGSYARKRPRAGGC
jgi:predicted nucleotidyltransferase